MNGVCNDWEIRYALGGLAFFGLWVHGEGGIG
jgi:hypothetical protein